MTTTVKHPQHIICVPASVFNTDETRPVGGFAKYTLQPHDLMIGQRNWLETTEDFRQILSVAVLISEGKIYAYRRGEGIGEDGLVGMVAVAVGGHFDMDDLITTDSVIDIDKSMNVALEREVHEETEIKATIKSHYVMEKMVCASETSVDRKHAAMITVFDLDSEDVRIKEKELTSLGFWEPQALLDSGMPLETWTKLICQQLLSK